MGIIGSLGMVGGGHNGHIRLIRHDREVGIIGILGSLGMVGGGHNRHNRLIRHGRWWVAGGGVLVG